jgi:hypothetical protein
MTTRILILLLFIIGVTTSVSAQYNSGDKALDATLKLIDDDSKVDMKTFNADMATTYKVPETKVETMTKDGMKPGDIFMACEVAKLTKKPVEEVVKVYQVNKKKGWGAIAKELGIKPGSAEFKTLKGNADAKTKKGKEGKSATPKPKDEKAKSKS